KRLGGKVLKYVLERASPEENFSMNYQFPTFASRLLHSTIAFSLLLPLALMTSGGACAKDKGDYEKKGGKSYPGKSIEQISALMPKARKGSITFPTYDQGGSYYYHKGEYEKARQYWMTALKLAEKEVPAERARGLSQSTETATCNLIKHLMYLISDSHYKPGYYSNQASTPYDLPPGIQPLRDPDPRKVQLYNLRAQMRGFEADAQWWERLKVFAKRALGDGHRCMYQPMEIMEVNRQYKIVNTKYAIKTLESELGVQSLDSKETPWSGGYQNPTGKNGGNPNQGQVENPWP
ncbi:MAG TPA: hypothetical protein PL112_20980, partial [Candidatus Obscuribacter sp.]|nr:hypothetical protein [Candidatus Obscuribacter sp.]